MAVEHPMLHSKIEVRLEETASGEPRCWVKVLSPGARKPIELSYREVIGRPAVVDEDRAIKQEVQRQRRALMRSRNVRSRSGVR